MRVEIENTSSPGASFTDNTNNVLLKTYEWICEHSGLTLPFRDFRMKLQADKGVNDNNNRNIYPLLKNSGLVNYEKNNSLCVDSFFTNTGLAYVKTVEAIHEIESEDYNDEQKKTAIKKMKLIQNEIIYEGIKKLMKQPDVNYVEPMRNLIGYLLKYDKVDKYEYAYLLSELKDNDLKTALDNMKDNVEAYRKGELEIDVLVEVRNDIDIRERTNSEHRKEGITYLTSVGYLTNLLSQAGLIRKNKNYHCVEEEKRTLLKELGGINND